MKSVHSAIVRVIALAAVVLPAGAAAGSVLTPPDLPVNFVVCPSGRAIPLRAGVRYQATQFPIALQLTLPDGSWSGGQWKTASAGCDALRIHYLGHPPYFGWVALDQGSGASIPHGSILIMSSYGSTPSAATAVNRLRTGLPSNEITYQPTSRIRLAGFYGYQFDCRVVGQHHIFLPFTRPGGAIGGGPDGVEVEHGWVLRVMALNIRSKTVVVYIANVALPASRFPSFLTKVNRVLRTLSFPKGA